MRADGPGPQGVLAGRSLIQGGEESIDHRASLPRASRPNQVQSEQPAAIGERAPSIVIPVEPCIGGGHTVGPPGESSHCPGIEQIQRSFGTPSFDAALDFADSGR